MARKPNPAVVAENTAAPAADIEANQAQAAERSALILKQFGDGLPFDLHRYEHVIRTHLSRSAEEMLSAGRALLVVREHIPHGEWLESLARLGLEPRVAQRMSQAALKFSNASTSTHLIEAAGNKSKLIELMVLDDDEVAELNAGGTVAGLQLDDITSMSVSDLRKALREARAEGETNDKLLSDKNDQIEKLKKERDAAKRRIKAEPPEEHMVNLRKEFVAEITALESALRTTIRDGIQKLREAGMEAGEADLTHDGYAADALNTIRRALADLHAEFGLPESTGDTTPAWAVQD